LKSSHSFAFAETGVPGDFDVTFMFKVGFGGRLPVLPLQLRTPDPLETRGEITSR
jgi:hypothetical protein